MPKKILGGLDLLSALIVGLADPTGPQHAATKNYVDNLVGGLGWKNEVRVATTANGPLATAFANGQTIDTVTLATGDRILLKNQTTQTENGIYIVAASGAPARASDADATAELNNATVMVTDGTTNGGTMWTQTTKNPTVGSSNIVFAQFSIGVTYTADGQGIEVSAGQFSIELDGTDLLKSATGLKINPAYAGLIQRFDADCAATTNPQTFTHNLGIKDVHVFIRETATDELVEAKITAPTTNTVVVDFGGAPTAGQYRVIIKR